MGKIPFKMDSIDAECDVCGRQLSRKYGNESYGLFVCTFCTKYRPVIHAYRFVMYMASKECRDVHGDIDLAPPAYSNLDCSCETCSARKVLRFIEAYKKS